MKKHFKLTICIIFAIAILFRSIPVKASSALPIGVNTDLMGFGEFCSWVMLFFGVHDNNANSNDIYHDTDFINSLNNSGWTSSDYYAETGKSPEQLLQEMYDKYANLRYKVEMTQDQFSALASSIVDAFQGQSTKAIRIYNESSIGEYTKQYVEGELDKIANGLSTVANERTWNDYWNSVIDIQSIYTVITQYSEHDDYNFYHINIYCFEDDETPVINADNSITYTGTMRLFDCFFYQRFIGISNTDIGTQEYPSGTTASTLNAPVLILKDSTTGGLALIDVGIQTLLETGDSTLVTPYTGVGENAITIPVPAIDMDRLVTDVKTGVTTATQAIATSQAVVADKTDEQSMANAIAATASSVPQFETFSLVTLFPFCIPFDFRDFLMMFVDTPKTPEFDLKLPTGLKNNGELQWYIQHVDLHQFDTIAEITRDIEFVMFCIGLCLITRNIMIRS